MCMSSHIQYICHAQKKRRFWGGSGDENEYLFVENRILEGIAGIAMDKNVDDVFPTSSAFREDNEAGI